VASHWTFLLIVILLLLLALLPVWSGGGSAIRPAGSRARCARVLRQHMDVLSKNPAGPTRTPEGGAQAGSPSLWLLSLGEQEKVTRTPLRRTKPDDIIPHGERINGAKHGLNIGADNAEEKHARSDRTQATAPPPTNKSNQPESHRFKDCPPDDLRPPTHNSSTTHLP
jgi:hypothetical protein